MVFQMRLKPDISRVQVRCLTYLEQNSSVLKTTCLHHQKLTLSPKYLSSFLMHTAESLHLVSIKSEGSTQISGCSMLYYPFMAVVLMLLYWRHVSYSSFVLVLSIYFQTVFHFMLQNNMCCLNFSIKTKDIVISIVAFHILDISLYLTYWTVLQIECWA
jgi:hypothetical protein